MSRLTKGYLIALTAITIWSTTGILIDYLISHYDMPALLLSFWRNVLVCVALVPPLAIIRRSLLRIERAHIRFFVFYGVVLALFNSIWTLSVQENGAGVATVLGYSSAGFTAIFAWWIFKERLGAFKITAISLSLTGCVLVANAYDPEMWNLKLLGVTTGLLSGVLFASYNMMAKEATKRGISAWTSLLYSFAFGAVFILIFNLLPLPGAAGSLAAIPPTLPIDGWLVLIILSFIPTLLGYGLYNTSMHYLPASVASLLATIEPLMTSVEAYLLLGERMTMIQVIGSVLIVLGVIVMRFEKEERSVLVASAA
ncbi:MAG: EamA family transporter [Anaerolineae bacterium]|nr:EamA family transporter [Anaerolineae bacterium]